jgi:hypothetical protein
MYFEKVHEEDMIALGLGNLTPSMEVVEQQTTFFQQFDVESYPFEYHWLTFTFGNAYSDKIVNLTQFPIPPDVVPPTVPAGWTYQKAYCEVTTRESGEISGLGLGEGAPSAYHRGC